jgi:hypothetical protein
LAAAPVLVRRLSAPAEVRSVALMALGRLGTPDVFEIASRAILEESSLIGTATKVLARLGDIRGVNALLPLLGDREHRAKAQKAIHRILISQKPSELLRLALSEDAELAILAERALPDVVGGLAEGDFLRAIASKKPGVRLAAVKALRSDAWEANRNLLVPMLRDPEETVIAATLRAIAAAGHEAAVPDIKPFLAHESTSVRFAALLALQRAGSIPKDTKLLELLSVRARGGMQLLRDIRLAVDEAHILEVASRMRVSEAAVRGRLLALSELLGVTSIWFPAVSESSGDPKLELS